MESSKSKEIKEERVKMRKRENRRSYSTATQPWSRSWNETVHLMQCYRPGFNPINSLASSPFPIKFILSLIPSHPLVKKRERVSQLHLLNLSLIKSLSLFLLFNLKLLPVCYNFLFTTHHKKRWTRFIRLVVFIILVNLLLKLREHKILDRI